MKEIIEAISRGRTDRVVELIGRPDWTQWLDRGEVNLLQWLIYYNDLTGIKAVLAAGGTLASIDLNEELGNAAFFGHWKICDFLIGQGANVNARRPDTGETPLHNAVSKAGRPYYHYTVRLLVERGADVNATTVAGQATGAFMRDVRTKGETPLHRAAAYADEQTVRFLLEHGANVRARDAHGNSPLSWASEHLRPGSILALLAFDDFTVSEAYRARNTSDHGQGWGSGMDWNLLGDYLPDGDKGSR